jgi:hypothetical protein
MSSITPNGVLTTGNQNAFYSVGAAGNIRYGMVAPPSGRLRDGIQRLY